MVDASTLTGGTTLLSLGGELYGAVEAAGAAKKLNAAQQQQFQLEMQADQQRRNAMEISARRQQLQTVRNAQQASAQALSSAVSSGAQFSSSAQSGQRQAGAQAAYGNLGVSQNLQIGENLFNINQEIDVQKMIEAQAQSQIGNAQGLGAIFGALGSQAGNIGKLGSLIPNG